MANVYIQEYALFKHLQRRRESWPDFYVVLAECLRLIGIEEVATDLLVTDFLEQRVEEDFVEDKSVIVSLSYVLHPRYFKSVRDTIIFCYLIWNLLRVLKRVKTTTHEYEEPQVFLDLLPDCVDYLVSDFLGVVWHLRSELDCILEDLILFGVDEVEAIVVGHQVDFLEVTGGYCFGSLR